MARAVAVRLAALLLTLFAASILLFVAINILPGSAARSALGLQATAPAIARFEAQHGLDRPWASQYWDWLRGISHGDFGTSFQNGIAVGPELMIRVPVTLELALLAFAIANLLAIPLGAWSASRHRRPIDTIVGAFSVLANAMPSYWLATLLVILFALTLGWLPVSGFAPLFVDPVLNLRQMILPALSLGFVSFGLLVRIMRTSAIDVYSSDYVRTAAAKGASAVSIFRRHVLRNALLPYLHVATAEFGFLVGSVVIIEDIFRLPGLGSLVLVGILNRDYPVLMAGALAITIFVLISNVLVDLASLLIDPRQSRISDVR